MITTCGVFLYSNQIDRVLVGHITNQNAWSIPKGHLDDTDSDYFSCAVRELYEETNIKINQINVLNIKDLGFSEYRGKNKRIRSYLVVTDTPIEEMDIKCNSYFDENGLSYPEFDSYKWIKIDSLKHYVHYAQSQNTDVIKNLIY